MDNGAQLIAGDDMRRIALAVATMTAAALVALVVYEIMASGEEAAPAAPPYVPWWQFLALNKRVCELEVAHHIASRPKVTTTKEEFAARVATGDAL